MENELLAYKIVQGLKQIINHPLFTSEMTESGNYDYTLSLFGQKVYDNILQVLKDEENDSKK